MHSLRDLLQEAQQSGKAIGHFNISDLVLLKAVFGAARELNVPVLVGLSEGEREFVGARPIAAFLRSLREEFDYPIFLNADHTTPLQRRWRLRKLVLTRSSSICPPCPLTRMCSKPSRLSKR
jgi:fructose-bisphosphate aldolase class II